MSITSPTFDNRITRLLGVTIPIANAPMGFVANTNLVAAMAEAGAIGLVPGSVGTVAARKDIRAMRERTDRPFGVNIPISFVQDPAIIDMLVEERVDFVTTSAGSARKYTPILKEAGLTVLHVVLSLESARRAVDAGVDGLVVEGSEGAGLRGRQEISSMVLLPLITSHLDVPVIAAGGIADGVSMAAAFALGGGSSADGDPYAGLGRVGCPSQHEAGDPRRSGNRHVDAQPPQRAIAARPANGDAHRRSNRSPRATL